MTHQEISNEFTKKLTKKRAYRKLHQPNLQHQLEFMSVAWLSGDSSKIKSAQEQLIATGGWAKN